MTSKLESLGQVVPIAGDWSSDLAGLGSADSWSSFSFAPTPLVVDSTHARGHTGAHRAGAIFLDFIAEQMEWVRRDAAVLWALDIETLDSLQILGGNDPDSALTRCTGIETVSARWGPHGGPLDA